MLRKRATGSIRRDGRHDGVRFQLRNGAAADGAAGGWMSRRKFLQRSGIAAIGVAALDGLDGSMVVKAAERTSYQEEGKVELRSEEHTSELQSLMRISYAVFCLKKKKKNTPEQE